MKGVKRFREAGCDGILAVGGGSSIDVAKCIKLFVTMDDSKIYLEQKYEDNNVLLIALPTTSGTGSESTKFAVIYHEGRKQSVTHESIIPKYALLDCRNLVTLPDYQKKCTMMDALCQSIEAWWSVNATEESIAYSRKALTMILDNMEAYLDNQFDGNENMMVAANYAGRAINIAQTTAAHAMSYKLTSLYKIPHGRAAFTCLPYVWEYMWIHRDEMDEEGRKHLVCTFEDIVQAMGYNTVSEAVVYLFDLNKRLFGDVPVAMDNKDVEILTESVNPTRLKNNPMKLTEQVLRDIYRVIVMNN